MNYEMQPAVVLVKKIESEMKTESGLFLPSPTPGSESDARAKAVLVKVVAANPDNTFVFDGNGNRCYVPYEDDIVATYDHLLVQWLPGSNLFTVKAEQILAKVTGVTEAH